MKTSLHRAAVFSGMELGRLKKWLFNSAALFVIVCAFWAGTEVIRPSYQMRFTFLRSDGSRADTLMSPIGFSSWDKSASFPRYVKWKDQPFAVLRSPIEGVGLFTDLTSSFSEGQVVGYAFFNRNTKGNFKQNYAQSAIGAFVNDSQNANTRLEIRPDGIVMIAKTPIPPNTEITGSYRELIALFPNDKSVKSMVQYW